MLLMLCIKVFLVRILDVSLGTVRTILVVKGKRLIASLTGFIEVTIWFIVVKEALNTPETSLWIAVAYAGGFATGTYLGGFISEKFIKGNFTVQVITGKKDDMVKILRDEGYGVSVIDIRGKEDKEKYILFIQIDKKRFGHLRDTVKKIDSKAFIIVNETKYVQNGYFK
ncbi:MAG: DUF5698 domain-containing protein [Bacilli bacterium]|nr:DUF5698 domain-containing protein [Bacilli bacterium]